MATKKKTSTKTKVAKPVKKSFIVTTDVVKLDTYEDFLKARATEDYESGLAQLKYTDKLPKSFPVYVSFDEKRHDPFFYYEEDLVEVE